MGNGGDRASRRDLLKAGAATGASTFALSLPAAAAARRRHRLRSPSVAVLGGGMAGLAAAHELIERGFQVTVYERKALGGKARSIPVPDTAKGGRRPLPGEHGFRFFPGFYHHVPNTMRRIPVAGNENGVHDNLVDATEGKFLRAGNRPDALFLGFGPDVKQLLSVDGLARHIRQVLSGGGMAPDEQAYFARRLLVFMTSCDERRHGQWEHTAWWDFIGAGSRSREYQTVAAAGMTRSLVAAKETVASARTIASMAEAFLFNGMGRGNDGALDRVLNAPTNEAWIDPWVRYLRRRGVRFHVGLTAMSFKSAGGRIEAAGLRDRRGRHHRIEADYFLCALPVERARRLMNRKLVALDPSLERMHSLFYDWMNGIQYYLKRPADLVRGHIAFMDSPWALTGLTQAQFWEGTDFPRRYGDGGAVDCLSIDISNWDAPGILYGKPAKQCTAEEISREVWGQIKRHDTAAAKLPDDIVDSWFLDPAIRWNARRRRNSNDEPLLVNTVGSWDRRPTAKTAIPNLMLAGDYVQTNIDLATMEGANESARVAVNAILEEAGSGAPRAQLYKLYRAPELEPAKSADRARYRAGQPNVFDSGFFGKDG